MPIYKTLSAFEIVELQEKYIRLTKENKELKTENKTIQKTLKELEDFHKSEMGY